MLLGCVVLLYRAAMNSPAIIVNLHIPGLPVLFIKLRGEVEIVFVELILTSVTDGFDCVASQLMSQTQIE